MSTLQQVFCADTAKLIAKIPELGPGYAARFGEAWRTPQQAQWDADHGTGISHSLHISRLAVDLLIDIDGQWQTDDRSGCYTKAGEFWKSLGPDHCWGGDFAKKDYDHFSITPDGGHTR